MSNGPTAISTFRLREGEFVCTCTARSLEDDAWSSTVRFEKEGGSPTDPIPRKVPGVFLDCDAALSAAADYAVRTVRWDKVERLQGNRSP